MFEVFSIGLAFIFGLAVKQIGLPPLVGFLAAGFGLNWIGQRFGVLPHYTGEVLEHVAHLGVLLLLFTVGLKLKLRQLGQAAVLGGGGLHFLISVAVFAPALFWWMGLDLQVAALVGVALAFSSTVLAAKILEAKRELTAFHGRMAIGILIVQDLIALLVLSIFSDKTPSIWALAVFALPLLRPVIYWLLDLSGRDEMLVLMGMLLATVLGGMGFEAVGLSSEVGALLMGVLLAGHPRASDVSESLWGLKELFLVGFFLQIGMSGLPTLGDWLFALTLIALLPLKGLLFFFILAAFHLRARNAFLAALALTAYSEFGLIVAAGIPVMNEWLVPLALTVSLGFTVSAPLNRAAHALFERYENRLCRYQRRTAHPDEIPPDLSSARALIMGMGRTGTAAFERLEESMSDLVGIDADPYRVAEHREHNRHVILADAEDTDFWRSVNLGCLEVVVLAMDDLEAKLIAARKLRERGFTGPIISHALYEEHVDKIRAAGADETYLTMREAGLSLAGHAIKCLEQDQGTRDWV
ncbi:cation:proton antiporter family protein [Wenzhouxiangella marina]|uniref:Putative potassium efflux transporter n=1 Tax=Wenzhouxiangella marina TaxID=1579979 RepID=A0A0K0XT91_9GAMM|nr:cation:proton antiporter family protein [Wenzhouxiangella marina]AKS40836.1 Putative potassium efflux transporter [Wenzhouxiangella marina]MBB6087710.1 putative Kef-type K+ transport protein [Wenzhouxiangella marina]